VFCASVVIGMCDTSNQPDYARAQYGIVKAYIQIADTFPDQNKKVDLELAKL